MWRHKDFGNGRRLTGRFNEARRKAYFASICTYGFMIAPLVLFSFGATGQLPATVSFGAGDHDAVIFGGTADDRLSDGRAIAAGDINGDGIADLVIGAILADGPGEARVNAAGEVYVYFGSQTLLTGDLDVAGIAGRAPDLTIYGAEALDLLAFDKSLAVGDVNGDNIDDIIVGARNASGPSNGRSLSGEAYIIYGSETLPSTVDIANNEQDVIIYGESADDNMTDGGIFIADLNGDGIDDIVIPAYKADGVTESKSRSGEVYIIFGSGTLPSIIDVEQGGGTQGPPPDVIIYGTDTFDELSVTGAMNADDVNGDGINDLIIGTRVARGPGNTRPYAGEAYIFYGSTSWPAIIDMASTPADVTIYGLQDDNLTTTNAITTGDFNTDGLADVVLGALAGDGPGNARGGAGEAYIIYGSATLPATIDLQANEQDVIIYGATAGDSLTTGGAMLSGDVNQDGVDDLILGASQADGPGEARNAAGEAYVIFGIEDGNLPAIIDLASGDEDVLIYGASAIHVITNGGAMALTDCNGDGSDDLIIGSPNAGRAYIINGSATLPGIIDFANTDEDVTLIAPISNDGLMANGAIVTADLNGDGLEDLAIGAIFADGPADGRLSGGDVYVVFCSTVSEIVTEISYDAPGPQRERHYRYARVRVRYWSGTNKSKTTVKKMKKNPHDDGVTNLPATKEKTSKSYWRITSDRANWLARVKHRYTDEEVALLNKEKLAMYKSKTKNGPWTKQPATHDKKKKEFTTDGVDDFSYWVIVEEAVDPLPLDWRWLAVVMLVVCAAGVMTRRYQLDSTRRQQEVRKQ